MENQGLLGITVVFLAATVIAVPLARRLGLGSVLGYLAAGMAIGPSGFNLVHDPAVILHFAEFGVVLLLFLIGLGLDPEKLLALRRPIAATGSLQMVLTTVALSGAALLAGLDWRAALVVGLGLALSSTAVGLQSLTEHNLLGTPAGRTGLAVLLFQDMAVIAMLALLPLLAPGEGAASEAEPAWLAVVKALAAIVAVIVGGRVLVRPFFRYIASARMQEVFTAFSLLIVVGIAYLMHAVGLSMALGAFLAGLLLASSEYRPALETDVEPFKGLLMGLFFLSVGMTMDLHLLLERPDLVVGGVVALVALKAVVLALLARSIALPAGQRSLFTVLLSQGGEFGFILFAVAEEAGILSAEVEQALLVVIAGSMLTTPLLLAAQRRVVATRLATPPTASAPTSVDKGGPVVITGFGRFGQVVARMLHANRIGTTLLDHDLEHIELVRRFGFKVFYGDATRLDLLRQAGVGEAKLVVVAVDDLRQATRIVRLVRRHFPNVSVLARAWDLMHVFELQDEGVREPERETFEGALRLAEQALRELGFGAYQAKLAAHRFRTHDARTAARLYVARHGDMATRINISKAVRRELEAVFEADEAVLRDTPDQDWR